MAERVKIPIVRHLTDQDDLTQGRDAGLQAGQEAQVNVITETLTEEILKGDYRIILFLTSPKKRSVETASLVNESVTLRISNIHILQKSIKDLREIDQGSFILPADYKPGDALEGFALAGHVFFHETFSPVQPSLDNLRYRYGDALLQSDGAYKYPELKQFFKSPGESYRDVQLRVYRQILILAQNLDRYGTHVKPVIFTHGQPLQIFKDLQIVSEEILERGFSFDTGQLARICWDMYNERKPRKRNFGQVEFVSPQNLTHPEIISLLREEISFLENL